MRQIFLYISLVLFCFLTLNIVSAQLCVLSDEFDGPTLDSEWLHYQSQYYNAEVSNGQLIMDIDGSVCNNTCPWFHSQSAGFIYKNISGDFELISVVQSEEASGSNMGDDINNDTQLGGLLARNGNSTSENYVFNVVGTRFDIPSIETKSTTNNSSGTIEHFELMNTRSELRMTRQGAIFKMYSRDLGESAWIIRSTFNRPDLPDTLQVGIIAYAFESYPEDLAVKFDYVKFSEFTKINSWLGGNGLWNAPNMWSLNEVPDSTHRVIINNPQTQIIQIIQNEFFECYNLNIQNNLTHLEIKGQLNIKFKNLECE